nr:FecR domain-containing protein [Anaerolineae bacterium]
MNKHVLKWIILGAGLCLLLLLSACGPKETETPTTTQPPADDGEETQAPETAEPTEPPAASGRWVLVRSVEGDVEVTDPDGTVRALEAGEYLSVGSEITTGPDGYAVLEVDEGTAISLNPNSIFTLSDLEGTEENPITRFFMNLGEVFAFRLGRDPLPPDGNFEVETPNGVAAVRGSTLGVRVGPDAISSLPSTARTRPTHQDSSQTTVICLTGICTATTADGQQITLEADQKVLLDENGNFVTDEDGNVLILTVTEEDRQGGENACEVAQGGGLILNADCETLEITVEVATYTPTPTNTTEPTEEETEVVVPTNTPTPTSTPEPRSATVQSVAGTAYLTRGSSTTP